MRLPAPFQMVFRILHRLRVERFGQTAAALSFATVLAIVPMIAVAFALISQFPFASGLAEALERFLLTSMLPEKTGPIITKYVGQFAHRVGRVTMVGILALAATAVLQMLTIEKAFDAIWGVKLRRPLWRRLVFHGLALVLGPLVFGVSLAVTTYLVTTSMGLVSESAWLVSVVGRGLSYCFAATFFALVYWGLPNTPVSKWHAAIGGSLAALGFAGLQKLFALYIVKIPTYAALYGGFSAVPVFLIWIYLSWCIVLAGALLVAELPRWSRA